MKNSSCWRLTCYLAASAIAWQTPMPAAAASAAAEQEILLAVTVNGRPLTDATLILRGADGGIQAPSQLLKRARLRLPAVAAVRRRQDYYSLNALPGVRAEIETETQTLNIHAPPAAFVDTEFNLGNGHPPVSLRSETGAFLNYDINYFNDAGNRDHLSGLAELGIFTGAGVYTGRLVGLDLSGRRQVFRLDTQYTRDFPQRQASLVIGDSVTGASAFSRQVYFGGLQWQTKFSTVPGYRSMPLPAFNGTAAAPSVVDIYVDNVLRLSQPVDTGPFTINNLPVYAGQGNMQMVVRDVLGRQQVYTQSYITGAQLLRRNARAVSYEIGALRHRYGDRDSNYGRTFGSGTVRYGVSNAATVETHGEIMRGRQSLGFGGAVAVRGAGLLSAGIAAGRSARGGGVLQYLQFDRQGGGYAFTVRGQTAGRRFWQLGLDQDDAVPTRQIQAQTNISVGARANLTFGYVGQRYAGPARQARENFRAVNAGLSFDLQRNGTISIGLLKPFIGDGALSASAIWVLPLERQSALQVLAGVQQNYRSLSTEYQQAAPQDGGWGYRARRDISGYGGRDVGVHYLGAAGEYRVSANHANGRSGLQLEARGGVALLAGHIMATRWLGESFAMVEVPAGHPIDIYANNIKVGRTGKNGVGFIPRLVPYESNDVYLDDAGLPLSISLDLAPKSIVPGNRTGSLLKFHIGQNRSATLILVDRNNKPLATGVLVYVNGSAVAQEVALHGRVFVPAIDYPAAIVVHDATGARCRFKIAKPLKKTVFPVLGPYICRRETK